MRSVGHLKKAVTRDVAGTSFVVVGGGISGIQASLDIADSGFSVYLVDSSPTIGGNMAKLDKTFPTNDCSTCIEAPKMVEALRHPNIKLLTHSEVAGVERLPNGRFRVGIDRKPRFVLEDKCIGCGECERACIVKTPSEFDEGMGVRKAIYLPFPQSVPRIYVLDMELCRESGGGCRDCISACREIGADAVDFWQRNKRIEVEVDSLIVSTGIEVFDPAEYIEFNYGLNKDVITSLQFERIISANGPTSGLIRRPSDSEVPRRIAWVQCVGSRSLAKGKRYCSNVCCTYTTKQAMLAREYSADTGAYVFYLERKAYGRGFEEYYERAERLGVNYVRGRPSEVCKVPDRKGLVIKYENTDNGEIGKLEVDLLVLSPAIVPSKGTQNLARAMGLELDDYGFVKERDPLFSPYETSIDGVFACGGCLGPTDISTAVSRGSGAAAKAIQWYFSRGKRT